MNRQKARRLARKGISVKTLKLRPEGPEYVLQTEQGPVTAKEASWRTLIKMAADCPPKGPDGRPTGFIPDLMRKRMKIHELVDELPEDATELKLEDAEATDLVAAVNCMPWGRFSQWILDFCDAIEELPKEPAKE